MSEELTTDTLVAGENVQPVNTETDADRSVPENSESVKASTPSVELRDGKMFVDGVRVYSRDESNKIAANAKREAESKFLSELEVDSFDQVKSVVRQLQTAGTDEGDSLNIQSLKDAVKKREQTVEELKAELNRVKTDFALKEHIGALKDNMPGAWNTDQKSAVIDLMKARNMLHLDGDNFVIRNGEDFITTDGEKPDYATAVKVVGQTLGLPFAKKGVDTYESPDKSVQNTTAVKAIDEGRLKTDARYRAAYTQVRNRDKSLSHTDVTDNMIRKYMEKVN
jgi:hypothetical protein